MNVISAEDYKILEPKIKENKVCLYCWREFKKPIKTKLRDTDKYSSGFGNDFTCCQKCINDIKNGNINWKNNIVIYATNT